MGVVSVDGSVIVGPTTSSAGTFPAGVTQIPFGTTPSPKPSLVESDDVRQLNSPSSFVALSGVGATDTVTKCDFLYIKCNAPISVRLTMVDPAGGPDIVSVVNLYGTLIQEFPSNGPLTVLEAKGNAQIEYLVSGQS